MKDVNSWMRDTLEFHENWAHTKSYDSPIFNTKNTVVLLFKSRYKDHVNFSSLNIK